MTPDGDLVSQEAGPQTKKAMENLESLAKANNFEMNDIVKSTVFITDMAHQKDVNSEY